MVKIIPVSTVRLFFFFKFYLLISVHRLPERLYHLIKERKNKRINVIYGMGRGDCKGSGESYRGPTQMSGEKHTWFTAC